MIRLINIQQMAKEYPNSFKAPQDSELEKLKVGSSVKVCVDNKEKVWVEITSIKDSSLKGKIDVHPISLDHISYGDNISFKKENIYSVLN